ncbi:Zinc finger, FYVE/PHD-type [Plasmopara halstedii]|uniref:Zinc finger, FYVE/PHD-type n=1 Tax=Plasmopara halstedii TaxID=4781 RepID=A0A0P1A5N2_PLAHL|nr:Zinc finger, FYVE/PHD-type [Plasmopara halstedii]CEG35872.1 Zinc finger, FYVE/PHD-type [Plasmopara halstedii]|eukprot:XP_024572241.1 Zinc finger, FYVE/PHD-type [Plasmopara halstedii]
MCLPPSCHSSKARGRECPLHSLLVRHRRTAPRRIAPSVYQLAGRKLDKNIFPPLELTDIQEQNYEQLANELIKSTLSEYDQFVSQDHKRVDVRRWKTVRARDGITIFRERVVDAQPKELAQATLALYRSTLLTNSSRPSQNTSCSVPLTSDTILVSSARSFIPSSPKKGSDLDPIEDSRHTAGYDSNSSGDFLSEPRITTAAYSRDDNSKSSGLPRLLAVGTLRGSLDDVMYGVVSPDPPSVRLRSSYLGEHIADCAVLREIKGPSPSEPFRFMGIKWFVRAKHRGTSRILLPRDFVVLEFSGVMMRPDNSRVGFHLMHSVDISSCRQLHEHRILRAKLSSCYIFEETRNNCVQVFMTASVDPSGYVFTRMAIRSAATALSKCWKSISCAHDKKLAYCLQNDRPSTMGVIRSTRGSHPSVTRSSRGGLSTLTPVNELGARDSSTPEPVSQRSDYGSGNRRQCGVCRDKLGLLSKIMTCQLCSEQICNRCRIVRKLSCDTLNAQVTQSSINFCKKCVASVSDESALEIARQELWIRARSRTRASSAIVRTNYRINSSTERNTYATVILGRVSDSAPRGIATTNSLVVSSTPSRVSQVPSIQLGESSMGYSVGPSYQMISTQLSTPLKCLNTGSLLSKSSSLHATSVNTSSLMSGARINETLTLTDLHMDKSRIKNETKVAAEEDKSESEEPVVLDRRLTTTIRNLRHLDYVLSVDEQDVGDDLDLESEGYSEFESDDDSEFRSSYASSVAVLDDDIGMCTTPTSNAPGSQREEPIVEEDEEGEEEAEPEPNNEAKEFEKNDQDAEFEQNEAEKALIFEDENDTKGSVENLEADHKSHILDLEVDSNVKATDEQDEEKPVIIAEVNGDNSQHQEDVTDDVEVVEAAPVAEVHAIMLSQYEIGKTKSKLESEDLEPRLHRARMSVPSAGSEANYQHQLFQQMQDLHNVVESTYQVARANTEAAFKERDSGRLSRTSTDSKNDKSSRNFYQPFAFNVVGLRSTRAMTVGIKK